MSKTALAKVNGSCTRCGWVSPTITVRTPSTKRQAKWLIRAATAMYWLHLFGAKHQAREWAK